MLLIYFYLFYRFLISLLPGASDIDQDSHSTMPLAGTLSLYPLPMSPTDEKPDELPYFTSGDLSSDKALVFIGGLTSGLGSVEFVPALSGALEKQGWRV
jgi:hypothetical protein